MPISHKVLASVLVSSLLYFSFPISGSHAVHAQQLDAAADLDRARGIELYKQDRIPEAILALRKAVKENKDDYQAWQFLGLALIQGKDLKNATKSFETVLKLQPGYATGHTGLSYVLLLRNKLSDAVREAQAALNIDPQIADAHYVIGVARLRSDAKEEALEQAEVVIKLNPRFGPAYWLKSEALVSFLGDGLVSKSEESGEARKSRYREAAAALEKFLELSPNRGDRQTWVDQLQSLRFNLLSHRRGDPDEVASANEVTTRARVLTKPEPKYTDAARNNQVKGTVVLRAIFAADGTVKYILVLRSLPYGLTEEAVRAARRIKFVPAMIDGRPVSMFMQLEYNFNIY